jgi:hypothetical protein
MSGPEDGADDPFRFCVYCAADCYEDEPEHTSDCPSVTGLYPVRAADLGSPCVHCGQPSLGMQCWICHEPFEVGDFYVLVGGEPKPENAVPGIEGAYFGGTVTCIGCAALVGDGSGQPD